MPAAVSIDDLGRLMQTAIGPKLAGLELTPDLRLADTGLTSLDLVEVVFAIEDHLGIELPTAQHDPQTLGELVDVVNATAARAR